MVATPALACEPVVPFMQAVIPSLALSGSLFALAVAVVVKSALFAVFEHRLPRLLAAWRMFLGNVLTSFVGLLIAAMIGNSAIWLPGVPLVAVLCWLPSRRLVKAAPLPWLARISSVGLAGIMTIALLISCILFMAGQGVIGRHELLLYWLTKVGAIFLALFASVTLTTVWEEWVIWRLSSRPRGTGFFASVLRTNLYALILVMIVPAALTLPKRLKSPDFLARQPSIVTGRTSGRTPRSARSAITARPSRHYLPKSPLPCLDRGAAEAKAYSAIKGDWHFHSTALSPVNPRRKSVTTAAIQTRVFVGGPTIPVGTPPTRAPTPDRLCIRSASALGAVRCESCPAGGSGKSADPRSTGTGAGKLSLTRTGSNFMAGLRSPSLPATYSRRQQNTWFALMPYARATLATDAHTPTSLRQSAASPRYCALPRDRTQRLPLVRYDSCNLLESVHLRSKWTPIRRVHFGRMTPTSQMSRRS